MEYARRASITEIDNSLINNVNDYFKVLYQCNIVALYSRSTHHHSTTTASACLTGLFFPIHFGVKRDFQMTTY